MVTIIMSNVIISTARVVIVMFSTYLDDFNLCKFELSTIYDHLFEDVVWGGGDSSVVRVPDS